MGWLISGIAFVVLLTASLGCGGGLSEREVKQIADQTVAGIQADYRAEIKHGDEANIEAVKALLLEDRALRQESDADSLNRLKSVLEETKGAIMSERADDLAQHITAICTSDYKVVTLSIALGTLLDYSAGGESTLDEVAGVLTQGVPLADRDFYGQYSRVCGITPEGHWHLQPLPTQ